MKNMRIIDLRVNHLVTPLGFRIQPLSFSWKVEDIENEQRQKSARIQIFCRNQRIYDSGEDAEADSLDYRVNIELEPRTRYKWKISVISNQGNCVEADSWFETGKLEEKWEGEWIAPSQKEIQSPILRKRFELEKKPLKGRLYICSLGVYEVYINGEKVGEEYLSPGYHSYDLHLQAQTYDVSELLCVGKNEIQIWIGAGWYRGRLGFDGGFTDLYGDCCRAICELYVENQMKNSGELIIKTDEDWQYRKSPILESNIYDGEIYDARIEEILADEEGWLPVVLSVSEHCGPLGDRYSLPIVKKDKFFPIQVYHTQNNETILDFGQNLTGWVEFECNIPDGKEICLTASEIMQNGCFYNENYRTAKAEYRYISNGKKAHVRPHFTFYGFRYVKVDGMDEIYPNDFTAWHLRSDFDQTGYIKTGCKEINKLFSNALWSQKDNFLDVPTDCPQRDERLGWTGDAQIFSETACYNMYMPAFYRKYLWDMRAEQSLIGGAVPNVVPRLKQGMIANYGMSPWADAGVIIPWNVYLHYGSRTLLEECYPGMKAWVEYERKQEEVISDVHLIKAGMHFGDWLALDNEEPGPLGATDSLYIASAYYYRCTDILANAAEVLGYKEEAIFYSELAVKILRAIQSTYFDEEGNCVCKTQTANALAIVFNLIPEKVQRAADNLVQKINEKEGHLDTGFVGTPILCQALTNGGYHKKAVDLLLKEDYPGWLYSVKLGATTIWERWNSVMPDGTINPEGMNSLNHYSYGSVIGWMYSDICGIRPLEPGFRRAVIEPHPDRRLGFVECELDTAVGKYKVNWKYENEKLKIFIEIPFQAEAEFIWDEKHMILPTGNYTFVQA